MRPTPIQTLRGVLATLSREAPLLEHPPTPLSEAEALEAGWLLWRIGQHVLRAQEAPRALLRDIALVKSKGEPGPVEFQGPGRVSCTVIIQKPLLRFRKHPTHQEVAGLPDWLLRLLRVNEQDVTPVLELEGVTEKDREIILGLIDIETPPPRVSFQDRPRPRSG